MFNTDATTVGSTFLSINSIQTTPKECQGKDEGPRGLKWRRTEYYSIPADVAVLASTEFCFQEPLGSNTH